TGRPGRDARAGSKISSTPPSSSRKAAASSSGPSTKPQPDRFGVEDGGSRNVGGIQHRLVDARDGHGRIQPAPQPSSAGYAREMPRLVGINHVALEVESVDDALEFYGRIFDLELHGRWARMAFI